MPSGRRAGRLSKYDLALELTSSGWAIDGGPEPLAPCVPGGPKVLSRTMVLRSASYYLALCSCDDIFKRNGGQILHGK
eukprot:3836981-Pyramimonas_sp.AAC.1